MATAMGDMRRPWLLLLLVVAACALLALPLLPGVEASRRSGHRSASASAALQPVEAEAIVPPVHACVFLDAASGDGQFRLSASPSRKRATTPPRGTGAAASDWAACASYVPALREVGWDTLSVETSPRYNDQVQARAAGFIEGALTHQRIHELVQRIVRTKTHSDAFVDFLQRQDRWLRGQVAQHAAASATGDASEPTSDQSYWHQIGLVLAQLDGMLAGYNAHAPGQRQLSLLDLWQLNDDGDRMDLDRAIAIAARKNATAADMAAAEARAAEGAAAAAAAGGSLSIGSTVNTTARFQQLPPAPKLVAEMSRQELMELVAYNGHCSALVKLTKDDLVVGHNTWAGYDELMKSYKTFRFHFHHQSTRAQEVAFTSYPGFIWSSDDFVATNGGSELVFMETTLTILDESLYTEHVGPEKGVMSWLRATVSGRMASDAKQWVELFAKHNSGTYNNMWMVLDMSKVKSARAALAASATANPSSPPQQLQLPAESFFVLEQIPGRVESRDMSAWLNERGYFASYNLPFFRATNELAMYQSYADKLGSEELVYARSTRARIFAKEHAKVRGVADLQLLLRSNDYALPGSLTGGCPSTGIAARYDLAPLPGAKCEITRPRLNGATDAKVTSGRMLERDSGAMLLVAGPSDQGLPPFDWSDKALDQAERAKMHSELTATRFTFGWQSMRPRALALPREKQQDPISKNQPQPVASQQQQQPQQQPLQQVQEQVQPVMVPSLKAAAAVSAAVGAASPASVRLVRPTLIPSAQVQQLRGSRTAKAAATAAPAPVVVAPRPAAPATAPRPVAAAATPATRSLHPATVVADPFSLQ